MTYEKIFADLKKKMLKADVKKLEGQFAFQFCIEGDGEGTFYFELKNGALAVEPYDYKDCTATFKATAATFKALVDGKLSASDALAKGDLKVEGNEASCADIFNIFLKKAPAAKKTQAKKPAAKKETAKKEAAKPAVKKEAPKAAVKKEAAKLAEKKEAAKPAEKKEAVKPAEKKEAVKPAEKKEAPKAAAKKTTVKKASK